MTFSRSSLTTSKPTPIIEPQPPPRRSNRYDDFDGEPFRRRILYQLNKVGAMEYGVFKDGKPLFFIETDNPDFAQNFFNKFLKERNTQS